MKTKVLTIAAIVALAFGTANLSNAATVKNGNDAAIVLNNVSRINKIEIHGNVEVYVSDGAEDQVKVYNKYYSENALVQNQKGVLRIASYTKDKLVVWVTANELQSISVYDNSTVTSFGKLSEINLDVNLFNNASAKLDLDSYSASINVNDHAKAELTGSTNECELHYSTGSTINHMNLASEQFTQVINNKPVIKDGLQELADL